MDIRSWFGQKAPDNEPGPSVLAEWHKYETESAPPAQQAGLLKQMEGGTSSVQGYLNRATAGVKGLGTSGSSMYQMPSTQQWAYFLAFLAAGMVFMAIAFVVFLPLIIVAPGKFAITFTLGSALVMGGFAALRGFKQQAMHMISKERLPFSACYLGSMAGTVYASLVQHSYVLSLVCCAAQFFALLYYMASYFPGGTYGVQMVLNLMKGAMFQCLAGQSTGIVTVVSCAAVSSCNLLQVAERPYYFTVAPGSMTAALSDIRNFIHMPGPGQMSLSSAFAQARGRPDDEATSPQIAVPQRPWSQPDAEQRVFGASPESDHFFDAMSTSQSSSMSMDLDLARSPPSRRDSVGSSTRLGGREAAALPEWRAHFDSADLMWAQYQLGRTEVVEACSELATAQQQTAALQKSQEQLQEKVVSLQSDAESLQRDVQESKRQAQQQAEQYREQLSSLCQQHDEVVGELEARCQQLDAARLNAQDIANKSTQVVRDLREQETTVQQRLVRMALVAGSLVAGAGLAWLVLSPGRASEGRSGMQSSLR